MSNGNVAISVVNGQLAGGITIFPKLDQNGNQLYRTRPDGTFITDKKGQKVPVAHATATLIINDGRKKTDGTPADPNYKNLTLWNWGLIQLFLSYMAVGTNVTVWGRDVTGRWKDNAGQWQERNSLHVEHLSFGQRGRNHENDTQVPYTICDKRFPIGDARRNTKWLANLAPRQNFQTGGAAALPAEDQQQNQQVQQQVQQPIGGGAPASATQVNQEVTGAIGGGAPAGAAPAQPTQGNAPAIAALV